MLLQLPSEVLERIAALATVGSRARLAAVCNPLKDAVYAYEARTPAARLAALRGSSEVFWDVVAYVDGAPNRVDAARAYGRHWKDTGVESFESTTSSSRVYTKRSTTTTMISMRSMLLPGLLAPGCYCVYPPRMSPGLLTSSFTTC